MSDAIKLLFPVCEIFASINGEGSVAGTAAVFLRLAGCPLRCTYCDTKYAWLKSSGKMMTIDQILEEVVNFKGIHNLTLTGGEPLSHKHSPELISALVKSGFTVNIETNGAFDITPVLALPESIHIIITADYKLPSSGMEKFMLPSVVKMLREQDVLKLVIGTEEDLQRCFSLLSKNMPRGFVYLSPVFGKIKPVKIVDTLLTWAPLIDVSRIRMQLQLHKFIWDPEKRGV